MPPSVLNPQLSSPHSDLQTLAVQALRRYGDAIAASVDGEVILMFLEFGNLILDEIRAHPYYVEALDKALVEELPYYISPTDIRPIPDQIIIAGMLYHYAAQQLSQKAQLYLGNYARTMNQQLWGILHGHGKIEMTVVDDGSRGGRS
jgi:hypothetical protein